MEGSLVSMAPVGQNDSEGSLVIVAIMGVSVWEVRWVIRSGNRRSTQLICFSPGS